MLQTLRSSACEELVYTFWARLWRWKLRTCLDRGVGQLGSKLQVRQIGILRIEDRLLPSRSLLSNVLMR